MTDDEAIAEFEKYLNENRERLKTQKIAIGKRVLTWDEMLDEVRKRTPIGRDYLESLKKRTPPKPKYERKCGCPSLIDIIPGHCHDCGSFWMSSDHCPNGCR